MGRCDVCFGMYNTAKASVSILLDHISLLADHRYLGLACFASLDALVPRVLKFRVASSSAVSEPRTATSATTRLARTLDSTACVAYGGDDRRDWCSHGGWVVYTKREKSKNKKH